MLKGIFRQGEALARKRGYRIGWTPPSVLDTPGADLSLDLEYIIAHLMLSVPSPFFVEVGANDGISNDPLYRFITSFQWRGILLEPLPDAFKLLEQTYEGNDRVRLVQAALSERDGTRTLYSIRQDPKTFSKAHQFSSFRREAVLRQTEWVPDVAERIVEQQIPCISFDTLLHKYVGDGSVDILMIDTEGYDLQILKMIDFAKLRPAIICFEHVFLNKRQQNEAVGLLVSQGYKITRDNLDTVAYRPVRQFGFRAVSDQSRSHPSASK